MTTTQLPRINGRLAPPADEREAIPLRAKDPAARLAVILRDLNFAKTSLTEAGAELTRSAARDGATADAETRRLRLRVADLQDEIGVLEAKRLGAVRDVEAARARDADAARERARAEVLAAAAKRTAAMSALQTALDAIPALALRVRESHREFSDLMHRGSHSVDWGWTAAAIGGKELARRIALRLFALTADAAQRDGWLRPANAGFTLTPWALLHPADGQSVVDLVAWSEADVSLALRAWAPPDTSTPPPPMAA